MQNSYPIFESGQVLTSKHLNDLAGYLAEQDRLTRNKLIGIGVVCGLQVDYPAEGNRLRIGAGVALTSAGHLIVAEDSLHRQYRPYTLPTAEFEEGPEDLAEEELSQYPFFLSGNGQQIPLWELLEEGHQPTPGEPDPIPIDQQFLADKVVLLFLECLQSSLKSCELNDCSDKGAQLNFNLRRLLVSNTDAQAMLVKEAEHAGRPVDLHGHPKFNLQPLQLEKINPAGQALKTFENLSDRIFEILQAEGPVVVKTLQRSYSAYAYLLKDIYPEKIYPGGPFGDSESLIKGLEKLGENIFLVQYAYDLLYDLIQSHNEFLAEACKLEAECCPSPERFPNHLLLGMVADQPSAFEPPKPGQTFDPLSLDSGFGALNKPARFRHHFISSPLFDGQQERLQRLRSLHYRTFLLAYRYQTEGLAKQALKITPSRDGAVALSEKALPFYYAFKKHDDLHRNWSFDKTSKNWLDLVYSHQFIGKTNHPLLRKLEGQNFYRVEGILGRSLGEAMRELLTQKRQLGLSFGLEPVYLGLSVTGDPSSLVLDKGVQERVKLAIYKLLLCRFRDLDVIFLILMMTLFFFLYVIIARLAGQGARTLGMLPKTVTRLQPSRAPEEALEAAEPVALRLEVFRARIGDDKVKADTLLHEIRQQPYTKGRVTEKVRPPKGTEESIGIAYEKIIKGATGGDNLFDRTLEYAKKLNLDARVEDVADNIYKTVSLIDKSEELIGEVSSAAIAEIDFQKFDEKYSAFAVAYDEYLEHAARTDTKKNPQIAAVQENLLVNRGQLEAGGSVTLINSMMKEFQLRMEKIFSELVLEGYAKRHPGMEHKCGVPKGGTLILLYTHQNLIQQVLGKNQEKINEKYRSVYEKLGAKNPEQKIRDPQQVLEARQPTADPLDDFIVLGDFCIPYLCCDTDCSDIALKEKTREVVRPGIVVGRIFGTRTGRQGMAPLEKAVIAVTNVETKGLVEVKAIGEAFSFTAPAGVYRVAVKKRGYLPSERLIQVAEGGEVLENFVLDRPRG